MDTMLGGTILATFVLLMMALGVGWVRKKEDESHSKAQPDAPLAAIDRRRNQYQQHPTEILLIHRYRLREKADDLRSKKIRHFTADPELTAKLGLYDKLDAKEQAIRNEITLLDETLQQRGLEAGKHYYK